MNRRSFSLVTAPASEPITLTEAKAFLRVDHTSDDTLITSLITVAREIVENYTGRKLISQVWKLTADAWPEVSEGYFRNYRHVEDYRIIDLGTPLSAVASIKYYPVDGGDQATLSTDDYSVYTVGEPGGIYLKYAKTWPTLYDRLDAIEVNFTVGYANAGAIPFVLIQALKLLVAYLYEQRMPVAIGNIVNAMPFSVEHLLISHRVGGFTA